MTERPDPLAPPPGYGERTGRPEQRSDTPAGQPEHECSRTCQADRQTGQGLVGCTFGAFWHLTLADEQEHQQSADYCSYHFSVLMGSARQGRAYCTACRDSGLPVSDVMKVADARRLPQADEAGPDDEWYVKMQTKMKEIFGP